MVSFNTEVAHLLDLDPADANRPETIDILTGDCVPADSNPFAMLYSGHQFGQYVPQLGDGRALMLGEVDTAAGETWEIQLKGAGLTPFSRMGDGCAVLRSTVREYLCSAAMAGLGIATTPALSITGSDDEVYRESIESAAVLTRAAPSHIRFGNFEVLFYRGEYDNLCLLADFVIKHFYPQCLNADNPYIELLSQVSNRTAQLIAQWQLDRIHAWSDEYGRYVYFRPDN